MCVSFVRRMENMLQYLGPDIRVHDLKKNNKLFASISATQCSLPFCLQQVIPTDSGAPAPSGPAPPAPQRQRGLCYLWASRTSVPAWCPRNLTSAPNSVVLSKQFSPADGDPQGTAWADYLPFGGSPDCTRFVPPAESWAQSSQI